MALTLCSLQTFVLGLVIHTFDIHTQQEKSSPIRLIRNAGNFKAIASVTIDDAVVIHDIKVISTDNASFIAMPSRKTRDGRYVDIAHPINSETRTMLQDAILAKYAEIVAAEPEGDVEYDEPSVE